MRKYQRALLHALLLAAFAFMPAVALGQPLAGGQAQVEKAQFRFGVYYGRPYGYGYYRPFYRPYYRPYYYRPFYRPYYRSYYYW